MKMKEKMDQILETISSHLPDYEKEYIKAVVNYIDDNMDVLTNEELHYSILENRMRDLVQKVNSCTTGVDIIDGIVDVRRNDKFSSSYAPSDYIRAENFDYRTSNDDVIQNYIASFSNYGGLYRKVSSFVIGNDKFESIQIQKHK